MLETILTNDCVQVESDPDVVSLEVLVVVALSRRCVICPDIRTTEDAIDIQVHQTSQAEAEQCTSKDDPWKTMSTPP
jgi:hypothetical protein